MPRYIDANALAVKWMLANTQERETFRQIIDEEPTADVVPKSEVERLEKEVEQLRDNNDYLVKEAVFAPMERANTILAVRQEVARQIFEEIDRAHEDCIVILGDMGYLQPYKFEQKIAELKKKYTEGASE